MPSVLNYEKQVVYNKIIILDSPPENETLIRK